METDHERRASLLRMLIAHADLLITWALDEHSPALFHEWAAKRIRYRHLLAHLLEP